MAAASLGLLAVAGTSVAQGGYLNAATAREPVAVLGAEAAQLMGIDRIWPGERIYVGGMWFYVAGILNPATLAPQIDTSVLVGFPAAGQYLGLDGHPSEIYVRTVNTQAATTAVDTLLGAQANPENSNEVNVSQPSDALTAQADAAGDVAGAAATAVYAHAKGWPIVIPAEAWAGGLGAALLIGALAGLLPAIRAARLPPTQALWAL